MPDTTDALLALQTKLLLDLLRENQTTATRLLRLYSALFARLSKDWLDLLSRIEAEREKGEVSDALVFQQERIRRLRLQTAAQIAVFAREAERLVKADQQMAVEVGRIHAQRMMAESVSVTAPGLSVSFAELPQRALEALVGRFSNGEPLRALFDEIGSDAAAKAESVLFEAVATGKGPLVAAQELRTALGVPLVRAMAVARTEMLGVYRASNLESFKQNRDVVRAWRWNAHLDGACPSCVALHGTIHPLEEPFSEHVSGRCVPSPVTVSWADLGFTDRARLKEPEAPQIGPEWFAEQSEAYQRRILGPRKLALYRSGSIDIEDLVQEDFNPRWGASFREGSITYARAVHGAPKWWQRYE